MDKMNMFHHHLCIISKKSLLIFFLCLICTLITAYPGSAKIVIQSRIDNGAWMKTSAIYPLKGQNIVLKVSKISGATIQWYQIIPDISKIYKNANHPWEKNPYQWVGFGKIDYVKKKLTRFHGKWEIKPFENLASEARRVRSASLWEKGISWFRTFTQTNVLSDVSFYHEDVGSFWFQAEVEKDGNIVTSPGIEDSDKRGLSPNVFRVSIREGKGFLGYLTSFFNVPGVFGSVPYQSSNHIGADCADILIAAYCKWKNIPNSKNYNVAMLVRKFPQIDEFELENGMPDKLVSWEKMIKPGDFIAVRYKGRQQYQHIGALFSDADKNGKLDGEDLVIHAGPFPLHYSYLKEGCFDGHVIILRP